VVLVEQLLNYEGAGGGLQEAYLSTHSHSYHVFFGPKPLRKSRLGDGDILSRLKNTRTKLLVMLLCSDWEHYSGHEITNSVWSSTFLIKALVHKRKPEIFLHNISYEQLHH
jgi:hypothetical protein